MGRPPARERFVPLPKRVRKPLSPEAKAAKAEYDRARRLADPERKRADNRKYHLANRQRDNVRHRARNIAKADEVREYNRTWHARNPGSRKAWREANPDADAAIRQRYRAAKRGVTATLTTSEWREILNEFSGLCAYCGSSERIEMEHMTPLSRGGHHDKYNVVPACSQCNRHKGPLTAFEFLQRISKS